MAEYDINSKNYWIDIMDSQVMQGILDGDETPTIKDIASTEGLKNSNGTNLYSYYANPNVNPYIVNFDVKKEALKYGASLPADGEAVRNFAGNYDQDGIDAYITERYETVIEDARVKSETVEDPEMKAMWKNRYELLQDNYNNNLMEARIYGTTEHALSAAHFATELVTKTAPRTVVNVAAFAADVPVWGLRLANHLAVNTLENAYNIGFNPAEYADQERTDKLDPDQKDQMLNLFGLELPSAKGFDGSVNDYIGKNLTALQEVTTGNVRQFVDENITYRNPIMGYQNVRDAVHFFSDAAGIGAGLRISKQYRGYLNSQKGADWLQNHSRIVASSFDTIAKERGFAGAVYSKGVFGVGGKSKRVLDAIKFSEKTQQGKALRRRFDYGSTAVALAMSADGANGRWLTETNIPTKGLPYFEFDVPAIVPVAGLFAFGAPAIGSTITNAVPKYSANWAMWTASKNLPTRLGSKKYNIVGRDLTLREVIDNYAVNSKGFASREELAVLNKKIDGWKGAQTIDEAGNAITPDELLLDLYREGVISNPRRSIQYFGDDFAGKQAGDAFVRKMELLNMTARDVKDQHALLDSVIKMETEGGVQGQKTLEWAKATFDTQNRILQSFTDESGAILPRFKEYITYETLGNITTMFDNYLNTQLIARHRQTLANGADLGPLANNFDTMFQNEMLAMMDAEEASIAATTDLFTGVVATLGNIPGATIDPFFAAAEQVLDAYRNDSVEYKAHLNKINNNLDTAAALTKEGVDISVIPELKELSKELKLPAIMQYENIYNKLLPNGEKGYDGAVTIGDRAQAAFDGQFESIWGNKEKNIRGKVGEAYDKALQNPDGSPITIAETFPELALDIESITRLNKLIQGAGGSPIVRESPAIATVTPGTPAVPETVKTEQLLDGERVVTEVIPEIPAVPPKVELNPNATVDSIQAARTFYWKQQRDALKEQSEDIGISKIAREKAEELTAILEQLGPKFDKANNYFKDQAVIWKNNFGAKGKSLQKRGEPAVDSFNLVQEFLEYAIKSPENAVNHAPKLFGPQYKTILKEGLTIAFDLERFSSEQFKQLRPFLEGTFSKKPKITGQGEVITDFVGRDVDTYTGFAKDLEALRGAREAIPINIQNAIANRKNRNKAETEKFLAGVTNLEKIMERVSPDNQDMYGFIQEISNKSPAALARLENKFFSYGPNTTLKEYREAILLGVQDAMMRDIQDGSSLAMRPVPTKTTAVPGDTKIGEDGRILLKSNIPGSSLNPYSKKGQTKYVIYKDKEIAKKLQSGEMSFEDVLVDWNTAFKKTTRKYNNLFQYLGNEIAEQKGVANSLVGDITLLDEISKMTQAIGGKGRENVPVNKPIRNIPNPMTAEKGVSLIHNWRKRITGTTWVMSYLLINSLRTKNAAFQTRMFIDSNARETMNKVFNGKRVDESQRDLAKNFIMAQMPSVSEIKPDATDEEEEIIIRQMNEHLNDLYSQFNLLDDKKETITYAGTNIPAQK